MLILKTNNFFVVQLEGACDFDVQCNAAVAYSFCRWEDDRHNSRPKCTCFDGFAPTLDGHCHPVDRCHLNALNAHMLRADCSKDHQFCRYGHCLCKPGYAYEPTTEECLALPAKNEQQEKLFNSQRDENDKIAVDELKRMKQSLQITQFFIVTLMLILIVALLGSLRMLVYMKQNYLNQKLNFKTSNNANVKIVRKILKENTLNSAESGTMDRLKDDFPSPYFDRIEKE